MDFQYPSLTILGSSGSVGLQAIDVARQNAIKINGISVNNNIEVAENQIREFSIPYCACANEQLSKDLQIKVKDTNTKILSGQKGILDLIDIKNDENEAVLNSIIGEAGLLPTLQVLESGKRLALANKESLVCAGHLVMQKAKDKNALILPVDSEHSAIFQSLQGSKQNEIKKILLTASGGPFYGYSREQLKDITPERALAHPTWKMGKKITIDSATLMNKGFELIEAKHLFSVKPSDVEIYIHRQSVLHSAVEFCDNSIIGQFSSPDMRLCVQYALTYPYRTNPVIPELDLFSYKNISFEKPDFETFKLLSLAKWAIEKGGALPAVINASNEVAVERFLSKKLSFLGIMDLVETVTHKLEGASKYQSLEDILYYDKLAREEAKVFSEV